MFYTGLSFYGFFSLPPSSSSPLSSSNICHSFARKLRKIVRPVQAPHSRVLQNSIEIALSLHRFRRSAMKLTVLHRDQSRDSGNVRRWNGREHFARRAASSKLLSSPAGLLSKYRQGKYVIILLQVRNQCCPYCVNASAFPVKNILLFKID